MKNFLFLLAAVILIFSCQETTSGTDAAETTTKDSTAVAEPNNIDTAATKTGINVETFTNLPANIDGCACYFSNNEAEFKLSKYVYADNAENTAFINLNGTMTQLNKKSDSLKGGKLVKVFANDQFEVTIDVNQVDKLDETTQYQGTITVKPKHAPIIINNIYGECGC